MSAIYDWTHSATSLAFPLWPHQAPGFTRTFPPLLHTPHSLSFAARQVSRRFFVP